MGIESGFGVPADAAEWRAPQDEEVNTETASVQTEAASEAESAGEKASQGEVPTEDVVEDKEGRSTPESRRIDAELAEAKENVEQKFRAGLATLHAYLQQYPGIENHAPSKEAFRVYLDASGFLKTLLPRPRKDLYAALERDKDFRTASLEKFTMRAFEILDLVLLGATLSQALDAAFARLFSGHSDSSRDQRESQSFENREEQKQQDIENAA